MTLQDFFTSAELEDGLTTPARVTDLLTIMQNEKENNGTNIGEATKQWSAVAKTIAATGNKECLDLFIQLDGLWFINKWLNDAQKLINDTGSELSEELIIALLRALERLQVDHQRSVGSGVDVTVQGLVSHGSSVVQEKAKALCDMWAPVKDIDETPTDVNAADTSPHENNNEENVEQLASTVTVQQETDKQDIPTTQEVVMESEMETSKVENEKSESESTAVTGIANPSEDVKEKQEIDPLTSNTDVNYGMESATNTDVNHGMESATNTDVNHAMESATNTEMKEDTSDKDEEMVDGEESHSPHHQNTTMELNSTTGIGSQGSHSRSSSKRPMKSDDGDLISKRPSDMELDYGMVDPLELARQVANEVERDVSSREESCSTSTNENLHQSTGMEVSSKPEPVPGPEPAQSPKGSPSSAVPMNDVKTLDIPVAQIPEVAQESAHSPEKGFSGFDLNEEFPSEETETNCPVDPISTPISVVSASRAAAADGLPVAPLQFEGSLGWKGSAVTSAFRRIPEVEKTFSSSSSHNNSNQRLNQFEFDLNVSEGSDDKMEDFLSRDKIEEPSKLQLDLNSLGDGDAGIISLDWKRDGRIASLRQNGPQSPSVSSSSSSMQPSYKNIDLNLNDHSATPHNTSLDNSFLGKLFNNKRDESVISLFGTQVEVSRKDYMPPHHHPQPNGRITEPSVDFSLGRPGTGLGLGPSMPYPNLPPYGYGHNGFTMGPMYAPPGAIPYMVDSRGAPIVPSIPPTFSQPTQPFLFNMGGAGAPSGSNGAGPSRSSLDLNSGFMNEMGNRENNGGLRQFFNHNQASSSSGIGGKREEPDGGWELFPINYKHQQPPWQ
ncbi:transcription factor IIS [Artemisia annua]|uniref:Transcription factor IIS n=1 Tax=Artemisia annua TaxID=35608 RepID=A0A2U1PFC3_ARTAN|nr:transcription factor IIS [Artemisia annua]